jgi:hypothetical protein
MTPACAVENLSPSRPALRRLERLGLGLLAAHWMEGRAQEGHALAALLTADGRAVGVQEMDRLLRAANPRARDDRDEDGRMRVSVALSGVRQALSDLGFDGAIQCRRGDGWAIAPDVAAAIRAEIEDRA